MKLKKRVGILILILCIVISALSLSGCSKKDVPDGYQLIAREGDTFRLYVPTQGWASNTSSGVTSAYFALSSEATGDPATVISVYTPDDAKNCKTVAEYWEICTQKLSVELEGFKYIESESGTTVLGGESAGKYIYTAKKNTGIGDSEQVIPVTYKFMQIMAIHNGQMYVLVFCAPEADYDKRVVDMNGNPDEEDLGIIGYFKFAEAYVAEDNKKYDKVDAPEGMKLASSKERPYILFAPNDWSVDNSGQITNVYVADKSNLTVQFIMTAEEVHSVETYWKVCMQKYQNVLTDFAEGESSKKTVAGIEECVVGTFSGKSGGVEYKFKQVIILKGEVYYVITYTATAENYDAHIEDVNKMIEHFNVK